MQYAKPITVSVLTIASITSLWAMTDITPEERLARSLIRSNAEITERNNARVESYTKAYQLCTSSASGTSQQILAKYRDCESTPEPKLEPLMTTGSTS